MPNGNQKGEDTIDRAIKTVIRDATLKSADELEGTVSYAVEEANQAISKLKHVVWAVAFMLVVQAIADLLTPQAVDGGLVSIVRLVGPVPTVVLLVVGLVMRRLKGRKSPNPKEHEAQASPGS